MIHIFVGVNWFGIKQQLDELVKAFVSEHGDLALERIDASEASYEQILGAIESLPFLASKKLVVLQDLSLNKQTAEELETLLNRAGDTTDLIIVESKLDKRSVYYKQLKKTKGFKEFNEPDLASLATWLTDAADRAGAAISRSDAAYLVERVGLNQTALASELEKLIQYNPKITLSNIELLTEQTPSSTIFNLVDAAFSGNLKTAMRLYDEQRAQKVEPQAMHGMLVWQMNVVAACSAGGSRSASEIATDTGLNPYIVGKSQAIARQMGRARISAFLTLLRDIDYTSKRQTYDYDQAMRYAIVSLAN